MTQIAISEFRNNMKKYTKLLEKDDLLIMSNDVPVMKITHPFKDRRLQMKKLKGIVKTDLEFEEVMENRLLEL